MSDNSFQSPALQVRQALWNLQGELLKSLKEEYDRQNGYESNPTEWFQVLMTSDKYMWMRELTSLMADVDVMTELEFLTEQHVAAARAEIERLLFEQNPSDNEFARLYRDMLTSGMTLLPLHSQLKATLQHLPFKPFTKDQAYAERKSWHEEHHHQAKKRRG